MSKVEAVEQVLGELHLTAHEKWELAQWLQREQVQRWDRLFKHIDQRRKGRRFTMAEIVREIKAYRRERNGG